MTAEHLKSGDFFKLPGQRFFRRMGRLDPILLSGEDDPNKGKLLIVLNDCGQYILEKNQPVTTPETATGGEGDKLQ